MLFQNTKTGATFESPCSLGGGDWVEVSGDGRTQKTLVSAEKEGESVETEDETIDLSEMTVADLKRFAQEHGIDLGSATKKDDIIQAITDSGIVEME